MKTDIIICHLKDQIAELRPISRGELGREVERLAKEAKIALSKKETGRIVNLFISKQS